MAARTFARLASAGQGRRLFLLSWVAYAAAYVGRYNYSAVMSAITAEGTLTLSAAGAVSTGYFVCYAAGQILCGILSQKASPFGMIPLGLALSTGCNFGMGVAPAGAMPLLWAANGLFQAMVWPPIVRLFAECMPFEQQDSACVSINSTTPAGTLGAYALSAAALALAGWRMAFWACGVLMLAAAVLWTVGSAPLRRAAGSASAKAAPEGPAARKAEPGAARRMLPALFAAGLVWLVVPAMLHDGLKDGVTSWVPSMIQSNFGASPAFSAAVSMVLLAATTALMLGVNTMFINVMPVKIGRSSGAAVLSGSLNAITYLGAALATWGIGAAAEGFGWGAVFVLWAVMAGTALAVCLLLARPWGRFVRKCEMERGDLV